MHHTQMSRQESQALRCLIDLHVAKDQKYLKLIGHYTKISRSAQKVETVNFLEFMNLLQKQDNRLKLENITFEHLRVFNLGGYSFIDVHLLGKTISYDHQPDDDEFPPEYAITTPEERQTAVERLLELMPREFPRSVGFDGKGEIIRFPHTGAEISDLHERIVRLETELESHESSTLFNDS